MNSVQIFTPQLEYGSEATPFFQLDSVVRQHGIFSVQKTSFTSGTGSHPLRPLREGRSGNPASSGGAAGRAAVSPSSRARRWWRSARW